MNELTEALKAGSRTVAPRYDDLRKFADTVNGL